MTTNQLNSIWTYGGGTAAVAQAFFQEFREYPRQVRNRFFVERDSETAELTRALHQLKADESSRGVLLVGDRGAGKSSFIEWYREHSSFAKVTKEVDYLDLQQLSHQEDPPADLSFQVKRRLVDILKKYVQETLNIPTVIPEFLVGDAAVTEAFYHLSDALKEHQEVSADRPLHLYVDDIDYVDVSRFGNLVHVLSPLFALRNVRAIVACRPAGYNMVVGQTDAATSALFSADGVPIHIGHLNVEDFVSQRLSVISPDSGEQLGARLAVLPTTFSPFSSFLDVFRRQAADAPSLQDATVTTPYPASAYEFIQETSSGNLRYVVGMFRSILRYVSRHPFRLPLDDSGRFVIDDEALLQVFTDVDDGDLSGRISIQNLNERRPTLSRRERRLRVAELPYYHRNNSLYVILLENIRQFGYIDEPIKNIMGEFGFISSEIDVAVRDLLDRQFIEESLTPNRRPIVHRGLVSENSIDDFRLCLTRRGHYYLDRAIHWQGYQDLFGISHHFSRVSGIRPVFLMESELLRLAIATCIAFNSERNAELDFKVNKRGLHEYVLETTSTLRAELGKSAGPATFELDEMSNALERLGIIRTRGLQKSNSFLFETHRIRKVAKDRLTDWSVTYPHSAYNGRFGLSCDAHVSVPEFEIRANQA